MPAGLPARAVALAYMLWPTLGRAPQSEPLSTLRILRESEAARLDSSATRQPAPRRARAPQHTQPYWGVDANGAKAVNWYERAAAQGDSLAANNLCTLYAVGAADIPPDREKERHWRQRANDLGFTIVRRGPTSDDDQQRD